MLLQDPKFDVLNRPACHHPVDILSIVNDYCNPEFISLIQQLASELKGFRGILGDGNCYYRAVYVGWLEQLVLCEDKKERQARFKYIVAQIEKLLAIGLLSSEDMPGVRQVLEILIGAVNHQALRNLVELEQFISEYDLTFVKIARAGLANLYLLNLNVPFNGLTLELATETENSPLDYVQNMIMTMSQDARGPAVDACLLNIFFGVNLHMHLLDKKNNTQLSNSDLAPKDVNGYPPLDTHLLFRPGHYDLLQTERVYQAWKRVENQNSSSASALSSQVNYRPEDAETARPEPLCRSKSANEATSVFQKTTAEKSKKPEVIMHASDKSTATLNVVPREPAPLRHSFLLSVFSSSPKISRGVSLLLLLTALGLAGAVTFGAVPMVIGAACGSLSLLGSLSLFYLNRNSSSEKNAQQSSLKMPH